MNSDLSHNNIDSNNDSITGSFADLGESAPAYKIMEETGINLFLTGKAGTGKTTFLHRFSETTSKRHVILAPTGVAAINAGGQTIHSFFQFPLSPFIPGTGFSGESNKFRFNSRKLKLIKSLDLIVIDEISMVRPDLLDAIDDIMRRFRNPLKPFGGVQLLLIGDLRQLAPVAQEKEWDLLKDYYNSPYFFESMALKQAGFLMIELSKVYRQNDDRFLEILNKIRDNKADRATLQSLNERADRKYFPADPDKEGYIRLTSHNYRADAVNRQRLAMLQTPSFTYTAEVTGKFPETSYPAEPELELKVGAKVMFIRNDTDHRYYNGLIGEVVELDENEVSVLPQKTGAMVITLERATWENTRYEIKDDGEIVEEVEGSFTQFPLRHAWAITIHKSQGLTFDRAIVDAAASFAPGQTYVALSRCRSLDGLLLESPLPSSAIMIDPAVNDFIDSQPRLSENMDEISAFRESYYAEMLHELFDFRNLDTAFDSYFRAATSAYSSLFPKFTERVYGCKDVLHKDIIDVASKLYHFFANNIRRRNEPGVAEKITGKIRGGAAYFHDKLKQMRDVIADSPMDIDNKSIKKHLLNSYEVIMTELDVKLALTDAFRENEFDAKTYMKVKAGAVVKADAGSKSRRSAARRMPAASSIEDIMYPRLYALLAEWRSRRAGGKPAYTVLTNRILIDITNLLPESREDLLMISGISPKRATDYGDDIIRIVADYKMEMQ